MILFRVNGEPVGKGRPRVTARRGKNKDSAVYAHAYTPRKTKEYEDKIRFEFMAMNCERTPVYEKGVPLKVEATIAFGIPKSYSKKKKEQCRLGLIVPTKKPDIDNVLKCYFDAISNDLCFHDDSQITEVVAEKIYADEPYVEIRIYPRDWQQDE